MDVLSGPLLSVLLVVTPPEVTIPPDPLLPLVHRIDSYFRRNETEGITRDPRYEVNPSEVIRLSVVSQLLAYVDLHAATGHPRYRTDLVTRADFLVDHFDEILSGTAFDGMLAYAMLGAYEATGDPRYFEKGSLIVDRLLRMSTGQLALNWGLMAGMALSKHHQLTGNPAGRNKTGDILQFLQLFQHADGSFPHYCSQSKDIHYTAWMCMELATIRRYLADPRIDPMLQKAYAFLRTRVDDQGVTHYSDPCPGQRPGCFIHYYSYASGCIVDYDTRGWINELGYNALVFDRFADEKYGKVMGFLYTLTDHGTVADKWDYLPAFGDPIYPWATAEASVIRASVVFWSLASIVRDRGLRLLAGGDVEAPRIRVDAAPTSPGFDDTTWPVWTQGWMTVDSLMVAGADMDEVCRGDAGSGSAGGGAGETNRVTALRAEDRAAGSSIVGPALRVTSNPVRDQARLQFHLPREGEISLEVWDAGGRRVRRWEATWFAAGGHELRWDLTDAVGSRVAAGLYLARISTPDGATSIKVLVAR